MHILRKILLLFLFTTLISTVDSKNNNGVAKESSITLADGSTMTLENLKVGIPVMAMDIKNAKMQPSKVVFIDKKSSSNLIKITQADGSSLILTPDHPILSYKGWVAHDKKASAQINKYSKLKIGKYDVNSFIYNLTPYTELRILPIIEIEVIKNNTEIYLIQLENSEAAFIANNILVSQ